jgi:hypothetical protein
VVLGHVIAVEAVLVGVLQQPQLGLEPLVQVPAAVVVDPVEDAEPQGGWLYWEVPV